MKYDLHIHSKYSSDGYCDPRVLVKTAIKKKLSGIAVTDHNTIKGGLKTIKYQNNDFQVIVGSEINTDRGEVIGLFLTEEIKSNTFIDVTEEIKEQNGLVIIPHPFDEIRGNGINLQKKDVKSVDFVEVFNSRCLLQKYNDKARELVRDMTETMYDAPGVGLAAPQLGEPLRACTVEAEGKLVHSLNPHNLYIPWFRVNH